MTVRNNRFALNILAAAVLLIYHTIHAICVLYIFNNTYYAYTYIFLLCMLCMLCICYIYAILL